MRIGFDSKFAVHLLAFILVSLKRKRCVTLDQQQPVYSTCLKPYFDHSRQQVLGATHHLTQQLVSDSHLIIIISGSRAPAYAILDRHCGSDRETCSKKELADTRKRIIMLIAQTNTRSFMQAY